MNHIDRYKVICNIWPRFLGWVALPTWCVAPPLLANKQKRCLVEAILLEWPLEVEDRLGTLEFLSWIWAVRKFSPCTDINLGNAWRRVGTSTRLCCRCSSGEIRRHQSCTMANLLRRTNLNSKLYFSSKQVDKFNVLLGNWPRQEFRSSPCTRPTSTPPIPPSSLPGQRNFTFLATKLLCRKLHISLHKHQ